jgi:hypothetical protein
MYQVFGSPDRDRLAGAISEVWIEFDRRVHRDGPDDLTEPWARAACRFLLQADGYLAEWNLQQGWVALQSAQRAILTNPNDEGGLSRAAIVLRREVKKITSWRSNAIQDLISEPTGKLEPERVIDALWLRDEEFNTNYFKISLRRRHLFHLFLLLLLGIGLCLLLTFLKKLPAPFTETKLVAAVILFGALGAVVSVSQGLLATQVSAKIPAQQIGSFVVWMRPAIGATLALVALVILYANENFKIFGWDTKHVGVILVFAFVAGFSERFIVGAIERILEPADSSK